MTYVRDLNENDNFDNIAVGDKVFYVRRYDPFYWRGKNVAWVASATVLKTTASRFEVDGGWFHKKDGTSYGTDKNASRYYRRRMFIDIKSLEDSRKNRGGESYSPLPVDINGNFEHRCYTIAKILYELGYKKDKYDLMKIITDECAIQLFEEGIQNINKVAEWSLK